VENYICHYTMPLPVGPGLAIRVLCAEQPYMERDFTETSALLKILTDFSNAVKIVCFPDDDLT